MSLCNAGDFYTDCYLLEFWIHTLEFKTGAWRWWLCNCHNHPVEDTPSNRGVPSCLMQPTRSIWHSLLHAEPNLTPSRCLLPTNANVTVFAPHSEAHANLGLCPPMHVGQPIPKHLGLPLTWINIVAFATSGCLVHLWHISVLCPTHWCPTLCHVKVPMAHWVCCPCMNPTVVRPSLALPVSAMYHHVCLDLVAAMTPCAVSKPSWLQQWAMTLHLWLVVPVHRALHPVPCTKPHIWVSYVAAAMLCCYAFLSCNMPWHCAHDPCSCLSAQGWTPSCQCREGQGCTMPRAIVTMSGSPHMLWSPCVCASYSFVCHGHAYGHAAVLPWCGLGPAPLSLEEHFRPF